MGSLGETLMGDPKGQFVGVFFATAYLLRLIFAPKQNSSRVVMRFGQFGGGKPFNPGNFKSNREKRNDPPSDATILDAEYTVADDKSPRGQIPNQTDLS